MTIEFELDVQAHQPRRANQQNLSSPTYENIPFDTSGKSPLLICPSHPTQGALAIVTNAGWDAVDAEVAKTNVAEAYGKDVWFRRPTCWRQVRETFSRAVVATEPDSPGRSRYKP
jgi:hypothetical protein